MKTFAQYLCYRGIIRTDAMYWTNKHKRWCSDYGTTPYTIKFNEAVVFIEDIMLEYQHEETVNTIIDKVSLYYQYLLEEGVIKRNLFDHRYLDKEKRRIFKHITSLIDVPNRFEKPP